MKYIFQHLEKKILTTYPKGLYMKAHPAPDSFKGLSLRELIMNTMLIQGEVGDDKDTYDAATGKPQLTKLPGVFRSIHDLYCIVYYYMPVSFEEFIVELMRMELDKECTTYRCNDIERWCVTPKTMFLLVGAYSGYLNRFSEFDKELNMNLPEEVRKYVQSLP